MRRPLTEPMHRSETYTFTRDELDQAIERAAAFGVREALREARAELDELRRGLAVLKPWLTKEEAALYLGIAPSTFDDWRKQYGIPHKKRGKQLYFGREDLDRFIEASE